MKWSKVCTNLLIKNKVIDDFEKLSVHMYYINTSRDVSVPLTKRLLWGFYNSTVEMQDPICDNFAFPGALSALTPFWAFVNLDR